MEEILPGVYVDGAHNPDGIEAFLQSVRADGAKDGRMLLYSSLEEKACGEMIRRIADAGLFEEIVVTKIDSPRAAMPSKLARLFGETGTVVTEDTKEAFDYCLRRRRAEEKVYITGSLYLTGQIKALTEGKKEHDQF